METKHEVYKHNHNLKYSPANGSTCGRGLKVISEETWLQRWWTPDESSLLSICCSWSLWCKHRDATLWRSRRPSWLLQTGTACFRLRTPEGLLSLPAGEEKKLTNRPLETKSRPDVSKYLTGILTPVGTSGTKHVVSNHVIVIILLSAHVVCEEVDLSLFEVLRPVPQSWREEEC